MDELTYIIRNPAEYAPLYLFIAPFLVVWGILCAAGLAALWVIRTRGIQRRRLSLFLALIPAVISIAGLVGVNYSFYYQGEAYRGTVDLKWLLIVPAVVGCRALRAWIRLNRGLKMKMSA